MNFSELMGKKLRYSVLFERCLLILNGSHGRGSLFLPKIEAKLDNAYNSIFRLAYARHHKPWLVYFEPIFHCGLYCRVFSITDNSFTKQGNSSFFAIKSAVYNQERVITAHIQFHCGFYCRAFNIIDNSFTKKGILQIFPLKSAVYNQERVITVHIRYFIVCPFINDMQDTQCIVSLYGYLSCKASISQYMYSDS